MRLQNYMTEKEGLFDKDPEYMIRETNHPNQYLISKWTAGKQPKEVYTITNKAGKWTCTCPSHRAADCKHISLCKQWIKQGKPNAFGDFDAPSEFKKMINSNK